MAHASSPFRARLTPDELQQLDRICDAFERAWRSGAAPRIADSLPPAADTLHAAILEELIALEVDLRRAAGANVTLQEYLDRFPATGAVVRRGFAQASPQRPVPHVDSTCSLTERVDTHARRGQPAATPEAPQQIDRFEVKRLLGSGAEGAVFLAHDPVIDRPVAIKQPLPERIGSDADVARYVEEARNAAKLDHPGIVRIYDVQHDGDDLFIVQQYVDGRSLADLLHDERPDPSRAATMMLVIADALGHAHQQGVFHRDLKPANILVDQLDQPHLLDFGLAVHETAQRSHKGELAGSPAYMSPEQVRGESHRLDGRSDIWSLGVIFYEVLCGSRPFTGATRDELYDEIQYRELRPLRQRDQAIPAELDRVCAKCLEKRMSDRYGSAFDLADDLRNFLAMPTRSGADAAAAGTAEPDDHAPSPHGIVPKGLRSFDASDADAYLDLLPGPRDRDGLPPAIRFWKTRIEEPDADESFPVGVLYGPSGCGKSSLVKAGLLPRLAGHVLPVYVEATAADTEVRLLKSLHKQCPELPGELALLEAIVALRRNGGSRGRKVLVVIDQFEQWLHVHDAATDSPLVRALRHCDGAGIQCLVMVRDDFWMSITRFMQALEIPLVEAYNSAAVDVFDPLHARKVLQAFGHAYGKLEPAPAECDRHQQQFLDRAVEGLAQDGMVVSVRLALFAEMMKGRVWTPASLEELGGTQGVGVQFLESTFGAETAPPMHRLHATALRKVLTALLPASGTDIKGQMQSYEALRQASGCASRADFESVLAILEGEVRLITPTEPAEVMGVMSAERPASDSPASDAAAVTSSASAPLTQRYYQLTHDYLVPSLRDWLTRKQKETARGRAEIRLAEWTALWQDRPASRHLPSLWEYLSIRLFTRPWNWTLPERTMMAKATRVHALKATLVSLAIAALASAYLINARWEDQRASEFVVSLLAANTGDLDRYAEELNKYRAWATPYLKQILDDPASNAKAIFHARLMLIQDDPEQIEPLFAQLRTAGPADVAVIVRFLRPYKARLTERLWEMARSGTDPQRVCAAAALADYDPENSQWTQVADDVVAAFVAVPASESGLWVDLLQPVARQLDGPLLQWYLHDRSPRQDAERPIAAAALSRFLRDQPDTLADLALIADNAGEFLPFLEALRARENGVADTYRQRLRASPAPDAGPDVKDRFWKEQANAAIVLLELGYYDDVRTSLTLSANPSLRSFIIDRLARLGTEIKPLVELLERGQEGDPSIRQALILGLGEYGSGTRAQDLRPRLVAMLNKIYRQDPDAAVHGAAQWALGAWGEKSTVLRADTDIAAERDTTRRNWFINSQGQTFIIIRGPVEFVMGATERGTDPRHVQLTHTFAIASHEVTVKQFRRFRPKALPEETVDDRPVCQVSWYDAVAYCNWLSEVDGIPKQEWCYEPTADGQYADGMSIPPDALRRMGYRLATEAEWECVCRAGTATPFSFGEPLELLPKYACYSANSQSELYPVGQLRPNAFGAFDMHGNVGEWCQDTWGATTAEVAEQVSGDTPRWFRGGYRVCDAQLIRFCGPRDIRPPHDRDIMAGLRVAQTQR